ncbi:hypothetical protein CH263_06285 [Rhodococcus sp. 06-1059B-a]|nr:hypothetical protein CH263_06285 [Rhodococcus sp. 06-1059B-a]
MTPIDENQPVADQLRKAAEPVSARTRGAAESCPARIRNLRTGRAHVCEREPHTHGMHQTFSIDGTISVAWSDPAPIHV